MERHRVSFELKRLLRDSLASRESMLITET